MTTHGADAAGATGILAASDLGPRCDRAIDRAMLLARDFRGAATAATVLDPAQTLLTEVQRRDAPPWYRPPSPRDQARAWLQRQFDDPAVAWDIHVDEGQPGERLSHLLDARGDTLVVTGPVRDGMLGPAMLGSTIDRLLRRAETSLLVVRERAQAPYRHLLVASDFSEPSRAALRRARALFPAARVTLLHGFQLPMLGLSGTEPDASIASAQAQLHEEGRAFLRAAAADGDQLELLVEHGDPARLVQQYVDTYAPGLVVVGSHGRGAVYELAIGSVARRIVATSTADTLVVGGLPP
ncbi:universal stress protein [Luteimonas sp. MC1782]|uniref:universal stress protein n=1 Tax=Luteimonas sp. MC1782 TaxID=2760305 RepID=UPI0016028347|nr:universal stress protein [Luteimonas sp. MC1782]MBB1473237.1 universal stress protein [Luteimonas sp. MC1782]